MDCNSPEVSIIVPVYNRGKEIDLCLKSISLQTYQNYEVLIIDDGSEDNTAQICKYYQNEDCRFKYFFQDNKGVSSARNKGLNVARGKWITFVDSDDAILSSHLAVIEQIGSAPIERTLIMTSHGGGYFENGFFGVYNTSEKIETLHLTGNKEIVEYLFGDYKPKANPVYPIWNKFFSKSMIDEHNIRFRDDVSLGEDLIFVMQYLFYTSELFYVNQASYVFLPWTKITHLGGMLRSPENFWYNQLANYEALDSLANNSKSFLVKKYANDFIVDRPITRILYRYTAFENICICHRGEIISFIRDNIQPFFQLHKDLIRFADKKDVRFFANLVVADKLNTAYYLSVLFNIVCKTRFGIRRVLYSLKSRLKFVLKFCK